MSKNYLKEFHEEITSLDHRPKLLFHVCCGVCSVYPLLLLDQFFDITIYYSNSNIYPYDEYNHRLKELQKYLDLISSEHNIDLIVPKYDDDYIKELAPYAKEKEGGNRCKLCYRMRLEDSYRYAYLNQYDYITTVMSVSNRKKADYLNGILEDLSKKYPSVKPLYADFKKENGINLNERLNRLVGLYHQDYCGCPYSMRKSK